MPPRPTTWPPLNKDRAPQLLAFNAKIKPRLIARFFYTPRFSHVARDPRYLGWPEANGRARATLRLFILQLKYPIPLGISRVLPHKFQAPTAFDKDTGGIIFNPALRAHLVGL